MQSLGTAPGFPPQASLTGAVDGGLGGLILGVPQWLLLRPLGVTVAWGLPYFSERVPAQARLHLPFDRRADKSVLLPSRRFPSDPNSTVLERNDVAVLLRSDARDHIDVAHKALFDDLKLFNITSIRRGFAGGGFAGKQSLPKKMAMAAR